MTALLDRAEILRKARDYSGSGEWLDESENGHDAQFGSTAGDDTNDPLFLPYDGTQHIHLPGSADNFVSTDDVNLFDADTAHLQQSIGQWVVQSGAHSLVLSSVTPAQFGDTVLEFQSSDSGVASVYSHPAGTPAFPVSGSTEYSITIWIGSDDRDLTLILRQYDSGGSSTKVSNIVSVVAAPLPVGLVTLTTITTEPTTATMLYQLYGLNGAGGGEKMYVDAFCIRTGSDATFKPSLRIVGDLEASIKMASTRTPSAIERVFNVYGGPLAEKLFSIYRDSGSDKIVVIAVDNAGTERVLASSSDFTNQGPQIWKLTVETDTLTVWLNDASDATTVCTQPIYTRVGDEELAVGARSTTGANPFTGDIYWTELRDGIDGPIVARSDFTEPVEPFASWTGITDGRTWTINRTATGRKSTIVDTDLMLRGTDDYHEVPDAAGLDFAADESFTLMSVVREYDVTPGADMILSAKKADLTTSVGWAFYIDTTGVPTLVIDDGTNPLAEATGPSLTDGQSHIVAAVRNVATDKITVYTDGVAGTPVTDSTVLTLVNAEVLRFGRLSGAGTNYIDGETIAEAMWREALTDQEIIEAGMDLKADRKGLMLLGVM